MNWLRKTKTRKEREISDLVDQQRAMWGRASDAVAGYRKMSFAELDAAREQLLRIPAEADANAWAIERSGASEEQMILARRIADEVRMFVTTAIDPNPYC